MAHKVLIIEDETDIARSVAYAFEKEGWETRISRDGESGLAETRLWRPDLIILDLILPQVDGFEVCRQIRRDFAIPIIMLTARSAEVDRIVGLELGADDYVVKPFSTRELIARARAILRRAPALGEAAATARLEQGDIVIDKLTRSVTVRGEPVELRLKEFDLLCLFLEHPGRVLNRQMIFDKVWGDVLNPDSRTLDVHVRWLREKIEEDPANPRRIRTIRGIGYKFVPVEPLPATTVEQQC
jgi:DNA-binding response OmpR family regulator